MRMLIRNVPYLIEVAFWLKSSLRNDQNEFVSLSYSLFLYSSSQTERNVMSLKCYFLMLFVGVWLTRGWCLCPINLSTHAMGVLHNIII